MKNLDGKYLVLIAMPLFVLACNSSGSGGGSSAQDETPVVEEEETPVVEEEETPVVEEEETPVYEIDTGGVRVLRVLNEDGRDVGYVYEHSDGDIELVYSDFDTGNSLTAELDVFVDGEKYEDAFALLSGFTDVGTVSAAGFDGAGNKFAVYDFFADGLDGYPMVAVSENNSLFFSDIAFGYNYVSDEEVGSVLGEGGTIVVENGNVSGNFGNDLVVSGQLDGLNIVDGVSTFTFDGESYVGDVEGMVFLGGNPSVDKETYGGFVSSDPSDEVLYSGGWAERSELELQ